MNRRQFVHTAIAGAVGASGAVPQTPPKLNFVVILMDDLGWADLSCYGSKFYETPNLDRLAATGIKFTNGYAACPVCSPSRASIMTGKFAARVGVTNYLPGKHQLPYSKLLPPESKPFLDLKETTVAEVLKAAGYSTAHVGKWHLGPTPEYWPEKQGFDVNIGGSNSGMPKSFFYPQWKGNPPVDGRDGEYLTDRLTDDAIGFIRANKSRPFFLYLAHYAVHVPIEAKEEMVKKYRAKLKPGQAQDDPVYAAMIESMDESVGRIMRTLEELRLSENTVVIFTSDNGGLSAPEWKLKPVTSNAPLREGKGHIYEGGIREPFIVKWPGVKPRIDDTPVCSVDILPTLADAAGAPQTMYNNIDGLSLISLIRDRKPLAERPLFWHYPHYSNQLGRPAGAVRQGDFKLVELYENNRLELYNLTKDIGEKNNLADKMPDKTKQLHSKLKDWRASVGAQMPIANPNYDPKREDFGYWWRTGTQPK